MKVRLVDGDPCGVLDDLLAGTYDPNDPLLTAGTTVATNSAWLARPRLGAMVALTLLACLPILPLLLDGQLLV
jgi:hypothetical protein